MKATLQTRITDDVSEGRSAAVAVAIFSADLQRRRRLEELLRADRNIAVAGATDDATAQLLDRAHLIVADAPSPAALSAWCARQARCVVLCAEDECVAMLEVGAAAVLSRAAAPAEILAAVKAVACELAVVPRALMPALLDQDPDAVGARDATPLTPRELEVLAAMADGASNKAIARRLGISFHTAKFHVAAILAKLDADTRTEAVTKAAQRGLVML